MILPVFLSLALALSAQGPTGEPFTVVPGSDRVDAAAVAYVEQQARHGLQRLQEVFPGLPRRPFRIVVDDRVDDLPPMLRAMHHSASPGFALLGRREVHVLLRETRIAGARLEAVLVHEMAHELLDQFVAPHGRRIPRWMHEGLAQLLAGDTYLGASEESIVWRAQTGQLLPFSELEDDFPRESILLQVAYAQSHSYVSWLERRFGMRRLLRVLGEVDEDTSLLQALVAETQLSTAELADAWQDYLLHGSGAGWRALLTQCFSLSLVLALPLLALALVKRLRVDRRARDRLEVQERQEAAIVREPEPWHPHRQPPEAWDHGDDRDGDPFGDDPFGDDAGDDDAADGDEDLDRDERDRTRGDLGP